MAHSSTRDRLSAGASFSGHERNHLFLKQADQRYIDASGLSRLDDSADGRAFSMLDFDRDGWQDFVVVNANSPRTQLFHNQIGRSRQGAVVAVRLVGGNDIAKPTTEWSSRDGAGAKIRTQVGDHTLLRESRLGEGMAGQNSATLIIGLGENDSASRLEVEWPSGRRSVINAIEANRLVTVFENPEHSLDGSGFELEEYAVTADEREWLPSDERRLPRRKLEIAELPGASEGGTLKMFVTMATWCIPCRAEVPLLRELRDRFSVDELEMYAAPVDERDSTEMLAQWMEDTDPPYEMLDGWDREWIRTVEETISDELRAANIPALLITNTQGEILAVQWKPPTSSQIEQLLRMSAVNP
jgi:thiol-disulfide isomerase/thioredoxin